MFSDMVVGRSPWLPCDLTSGRVLPEEALSLSPAGLARALRGNDSLGDHLANLVGLHTQARLQGCAAKSPPQSRGASGIPLLSLRLGASGSLIQAQPIAGAVSATGVASAAARSSGKL